nr:alpha/beta hydrolase-fold protein [Moraxella sp. K127]
MIQVATIGKRPANGYPVIYVLDGNAFFGVASSIAQMNHDKPSEKNPKSLMVVGIGYPTGRAFDIPNRTHDYTPPSDSYPAPTGEQTAFGGADYFHAFIADELAPMLDKEFGINPNHRTLIGHSYGGLFGLYLLMARSESFDNYVIVSPSIWWNDKSILAHQKGIIATPNIKNVLITLGEHELNARHRSPNAPTTLENSDAFLMSEFLKNKLPHANVTFDFNPNHAHGENAYPSIIQGVNMAYQACKADSNC